MRFAGRVSFIILLAIVPVLSVPLADQPRIIRRVMSDEELNRMRELEGVYEEGKDYNIIVDGHGTGLKPPTAEEWEQMRQMPVVVDRIEFGKDAAPPSHDNSITNWFPPIGNQDGEGSCVSWACGYYTKTFQEASEHNWDLSGCIWVGGYYGHPSSPYQDKIFSPDFVYHQVNAGADNGSKYSDNMNLLYRIGCCTWDHMPYNPNNSTTWPDEDAWRQAPWYRSLTGHTIMWVESEAGLGNLKQMLADGNVAVISVNADYYSSLTSQDLWTRDNYTPSGTNHANTVVGYDDNYGPYTEGGNPNTYGAFKVANSWGVGGWENVADGFYYISYACMRQRISSVRFYQNRVGYEPEMISVFQLSHDLRGECRTTVGIGDIGSPDAAKRFDEYDNKGGAHPFPSHKMVMDITEFGPYMSGPPDHFFLGIYDGGTVTTGTIDFFSIETYDDYGSGVPTKSHESSDPPVDMINSSTVYAEVGYDVPDSLWIVGGQGSPGDLVAVEVWLKYRGGNIDDSISSFDVPLTWDAAVCTLETLTIGSDFAGWTDVSRIDNSGTDGPPAVSKLTASAFTLGPPVGPPQLPRGSYLGATLYFRILQTAAPSDSTCVDTLMSAFMPEIYLGFTDKNGLNIYIPEFSSDCIRVFQYGCGDCNGDERVTVADATYLVSFIYRGGPAPVGSGDVNLDGRHTIADGTYLVAFVYRGGPPPCEPSLGNAPLRSERSTE